MLRLFITARAPVSDGFTTRSHEVTRLEAFSDAVFGFAVTLLVISLEVPNSFDDLLDRMSGLISFAICFALLVQFWAKHYYFFRRFGLQDATTIVINAALLFVLLIYIYPLKYLFSILSLQIFHLGPASLRAGIGTMTADNVRILFAIYGAGCFAIYMLYGALYWHAFRQRRHLNLSRLETFDTLGAIAHNAGVASVGLVSVVMSHVLPASKLGWAGWIYAAIGPVAAAIGSITGVSTLR